MKTSLGIYLGNKYIGIVEAKGKTVINTTRISRAQVSGDGLEEKVPDDLKLVTLFKDEFRKLNITSADATLCLSGNDLIIRTFEMPILPKNELRSAVNFEAKKYIPFKIEELIVDFQVVVDRINRRNLVVFCGIKREILNKYTNVAKQCGFTLARIEYSGFSLVRILALSGFARKGINCLIGLDAQEGDDLQFAVMEDGFPLFSRDISLVSTVPESVAGAGGAASAEVTVMDRLKTELRVSFDYFQRKFPSKSLQKIHFIAAQQYHAELSAFARDLGMDAKFASVDKYLEKAGGFSLSILKGLSAAFASAIPTAVRLNLVAAQARLHVQPRERRIQFDFASLFQDLSIDFKAVLLGLLICASVWGYGMYQRYPVQEAIATAIKERPEVPSIQGDPAPDALQKTESQFSKKFDTLSKLVKDQVFFTEILDSLPRLTPKGVWLQGCAIKKLPKESGLECDLRGSAFLGDANEEGQMIREFAARLQQNEQFARYFKKVDILSLERATRNKLTVTQFAISCRSK